MIQPRRTISEVELDAELDIARPSVMIQNAETSAAASVTESSKLPRGVEAGTQTSIEPVEIRSVEQIEHLRAELDSILLANLPILGY